MGKYFISTWFAFLFTLLAVPAKAQIGDFDLKIDAEKLKQKVDEELYKKGIWTQGQAIELGVEAQYQFALAKPDELGYAGALSVYGTFDYIHSYLLGIFFVGPQLRLGYNFAHSTNSQTGEALQAHTFTWAPGVINGIYAADDWVITQRLSLPFIMEDPGFEFDLGASYLANDWFAIEFGVSLGYSQTDLEVNGEYADWFYLGPYFDVIFEPWGEYWN